MSDSRMFEAAVLHGCPKSDEMHPKLQICLKYTYLSAHIESCIGV